MHRRRHVKLGKITIFKVYPLKLGITFCQKTWNCLFVPQQRYQRYGILILLPLVLYPEISVEIPSRKCAWVPGHRFPDALARCLGATLQVPDLRFQVLRMAPVEEKLSRVAVAAFGPNDAQVRCVSQRVHVARCSWRGTVCPPLGISCARRVTISGFRGVRLHTQGPPLALRRTQIDVS